VEIETFLQKNGIQEAVFHFYFLSFDTIRSLHYYVILKLQLWIKKWELDCYINN